MEEEDAADIEKQQVQVQHGPHAAGNIPSDLPYKEQHTGACTYSLHQPLRWESFWKLVHPRQWEQFSRLAGHQAGSALRVLQLDSDARQQVEDILWNHPYLPS